MLQFIKGPSGSGKTTEIYKQLIKRSSEYPKKTFLLIVPEQNNLSALKELIEATPTKGILNIDVLSFNRLCHRIFDESGGNDREILDDISKSLILRYLASKNAPNLTYLGKNINKLGYINEVKSVISEFLQYDITLPKLQSILALNQNNSLLYSKLSDIAKLMDSFNQYCADKYITTEEVLDRAIRISDKADFLKNCELYLDGFTGFTPVQLRFLEQMMLCSDRIVTTVTIGNDGDKELFSMGYKLETGLRKAAKDNNIGIEEDIMLTKIRRFDEESELGFLEANLYRYKNEVLDKKVVEDISITEYGNVYEEVHSLTRKIKELIRSNEYRYREIAILTGDMEEYAPIIEREFRKQGIPLFIDRSMPILLNPFTESMRAAMECVISDYNPESVMRYVRSGISIMTMEEADEFDNYLRAAGIKRKYQYEREWTYVPRYEKRKESDEYSIEDALKRVNEMRIKVLESLSVFENKELEAIEHTKALYNFIIANKSYQKLKEYEEFFSTQGDVLKEREYSQIYEKVIELLDKLIDFVGTEVMSLSEFAKLLDAGLSAIKVGMIPPGVDQVFVGDMERSRLNNIKALFVVGCNEGKIPQNNRKGGILSEDEREQLLSQDLHLAPTTKELILQDKFYLYMNLTQTSKILNISYPLVAIDGKNLRISGLVRDIEKLYRNLTTTHWVNWSTVENSYTKYEGMEELLKHIREIDDENIQKALAYFMGDDETKSIVIKALSDSINGKGTVKIPADIARKLYSTTLKASITRLEKYVECPYSHFLKYGLRLMEIEEYGFSFSDIGTICHDILSEYSKAVKDSKYSWFEITKEESDAILEEVIQANINAKSETALFENRRSEYNINRIKRILHRSIDVLLEQLRHGKFEPFEFEMPFGYRSDKDAIDLSKDSKLVLQGRIDRVDLYEDEENAYVKIVDYKSGNKEFSVSDIYYGLDLQLSMYLYAAGSIIERIKKDKTLKNAALLYYHIDDPVVERADDSTIDNLEMLRSKQLSNKGLVNSNEAIISLLDNDFEGHSLVIPVVRKKDGSLGDKSSVASEEEINVILNYVNHKAQEIAKEILDGRADVSPYLCGKKSGCDYCRYRGICNFSLNDNTSYNEMENLSFDEAIEKMRVKQDGI